MQRRVPCFVGAFRSFEPVGWFTVGFFDYEITKIIGGVGLFLTAVVWAIVSIDRGLIIGATYASAVSAFFGMVVGIIDGSGFLFGAVILGGLIAIAAAFAVVGAVAVASTIAIGGISAGIIAVLFAVILGIPAALVVFSTEAGILLIFGSGAVVVSLPIIGAIAGWRTLEGDRRDAWIRPIAIALAATGGTSFQNTTLIDADFTEATLKSTDFRKAELTRVHWNKVKMLDRIRPGKTYLQSEILRQLLITGEGSNQKFDRLDLRGVNLQEANLENASFIDADFYQANLQKANLSRAILVRANLERADLRGANLTGSCIQDWVITESTKLNGVICDYVYLKWDNGDKRDQMPPRGKFKEDGFVTFVRYILETVELYHEKDINPRLALTVLQKMSRDYDEPFDIVALGKKGDRVFIQVKVSENIIREKFKEDYYERYNTDLKLWAGNTHQLPPSANSFIEKRINEIASEKTDNFMFVDVRYVDGNYTEIYQGEVIKMSGDHKIQIDGGNYNERIEGDYIQQQGTFGVGVNKGKIKAEKIAGTINEAQNEVLQMIESLRGKIKAIDNQEVRTEALEHLEDVETETKSSSPKQSRLKSSLMTLFNVVKDIAVVANAVTALAERLGVQLFS